MSGGETLRGKIRGTWLQFLARPRVWQCCLGAAIAAVTFFVFERLFLPQVALTEGAWMVWWPSNGLMLGILLVARRRHWWWLLLAFATALVLSEWRETPLQLAAVAVGDTAEVAIMAFTLPRFRTMDKWLSQPQVALRFILMVFFVAPAFAASISLAFHVSIGLPIIDALRWGASDALGIILFTPLLLALLSPELWSLFRPAALLKTCGLLALVTASSWLVFHTGDLPVGFVLYPIILLLGTQLGLSGAVIGIDILAISATSATLMHLGPFGAASEVQPVTRMLLLQLYLLLAVAMTLPVSVARVRRLTTEAALRRAWKKMAELASVDGMTGVANRRQFDTTLDLEWARARRSHSPIALLMIDVDHFKRFNDNYGHLAGDACLRAIASEIASVSRRSAELVARYGGEEFAMLLPDSALAGAFTVGDLVRRAVHDLALPHLLTSSQRVTVSIGVASMVPDRGGDPTNLIVAADQALYEAKHNGRDRVEVALGDASLIAVLSM